jgi:hypothetical protein
MRASTSSEVMASPVYSSTKPVAPPTPTRAMNARMMSLPVTPGGSCPSTRTSNVRGLRWSRHCVASTCSTSLVPMPKASAPNAPCVEVWLSPHTMVMPGWVSPSSGPMTCTMPWRAAPMPCSVTPFAAQLASSILSCARAWSSTTASPPGIVGIEWSIVATVRSGRRTLSPRAASPENACGEVTSCTRWRSM